MHVRDDRQLLVLGYGNPGREDDGVGPLLVDRLEALALDNVTLDADYQLNIEDAATMAEHDTVLFVDASVDAKPPYTFRACAPSAAISFTSHSVSPESVLAICEESFGKTPEAWVLAIRGHTFEMREGLSDRAQHNLDEAVSFVTEWIRAWKENSSGHKRNPSENHTHH